MYNIVNPLEMTRKEFEGYATIYNLEYYNAQQLAAYGKDVESLIQKAQFEELSPEDKEQLDIFKGDMATLTKVVVVNDDLSKEPLFFRKKGEGMIEKSKKASIGEIRVWNGKKMKKQANGKWLEVSEQGETKVSHIYQAKYAKEESKKPSLHTSKHEDAERWHREQASKLSDKEYSDEELSGGEIRDWGGKKYKKQPNGKWLEVSEHGMTKKEHVFQYGKHLKDAEERGVSDEDHKKHIREANNHDTIQEKLSDKEYDDTDFEEKKEAKVPVKTNTLLAGEFTDAEFRKAFKKAGAKVSISSGYDYYNQTIATISTDKGKVKWDMEEDFPLERVRQLGLNVETNHAGDIIVEESAEIKKSLQDHFNIINAPLSLDIMKGRTAMVGEVRIWNGKKFKKQGNGKWVEVSESHGKTKKEHGDLVDEFRSNVEYAKKINEPSTYILESSKLNTHEHIFDRLSDKEYSDEEVMGGGEKKEEKVKENSTMDLEDAFIEVRPNKDGSFTVTVNEDPEQSYSAESLGDLHLMMKQGLGEIQEIDKYLKEAYYKGILDKYNPKIKKQ